MDSGSGEGNTFCFSIRVKTKARVEGISGKTGDLYKIGVSEAPEKGKANRRVCELLADFFEVRSGMVKIRSGHTSRDKMIEVKGISPRIARERLSEIDRARKEKT
jgi:uncharacterized protein YggU (UPF0235/DUF167 family)